MLGFVYRASKTALQDDLKDSQDSPEADVSKQLHSSVRTANLETSLRLLSCGADPNFLYPVFTLFHFIYIYLFIDIIFVIDILFEINGGGDEIDMNRIW